MRIRVSAAYAAAFSVTLSRAAFGQSVSPLGRVSWFCVIQTLKRLKLIFGLAWHASREIFSVVRGFLASMLFLIEYIANGTKE